MIRLTVKGREPVVLAELHKRHLAPLVVLEEKSNFLIDFYSCRVSVVSSEANTKAVHQWWLDDEGREAGEGFRDGALFIYSLGENPGE